MKWKYHCRNSAGSKVPKKKKKKKKEKKGRLKYIGSSSFHLVHEGSNILVVLRVNPKKIRSF